jgi:PadR family transcriptional regulator PadR
VRRRAGELLPIEVEIIEAALALARSGEREFYGFAIAKAIKDSDGARWLTAHGTLYKALARLERGGLLESCWEAPDEAAAEGRPRRRLYRVTGAGAQAHAAAVAAGRGASTSWRPGWEPA